MTNTITVNEQPQRFFLACEKWEPAVGHEIKVGEYRFCAIPLDGGINVSEVTSGANVFKISMTAEIVLSTEIKEDALKFFRKIGESLKRMIEKDDYDFDKHLKNMQQMAFERLGEMPEIVEVNVHD